MINLNNSINCLIASCDRSYDPCICLDRLCQFTSWQPTLSWGFSFSRHAVFLHKLFRFLTLVFTLFMCQKRNELNQFWNVISLIHEPEALCQDSHAVVVTLWLGLSALFFIFQLVIFKKYYNFNLNTFSSFSTFNFVPHVFHNAPLKVHMKHRKQFKKENNRM